MENFFKNVFKPKEEKETDGARHIAIPEHGGVDDKDVNMEGTNIENEIRAIEIKLADDNDDSDKSFLTDKLENLKAQLEKEKNK